MSCPIGLDAMDLLGRKFYTFSTLNSTYAGAAAACAADGYDLATIPKAVDANGVARFASEF